MINKKMKITLTVNLNQAELLLEALAYSIRGLVGHGRKYAHKISVLTKLEGKIIDQRDQQLADKGL